MARYIDADKLREYWLENGVNENVYNTNNILDSIDYQPTADVVEVVRCKDCKHSKEYPMRIICHRFGRDVVENGFCNYGERRTDNDL